MTDQQEQQGTRGARARWALALGTVAVLVIAFVLLRGGDDNGNTASTPTQAATQSATTSPQAAQQSSSSTAGQDTAATTTAKPKAPAVAVITIRDGKPVGGVQKLSVKKGDRLRFVVRADSTVPIHFHGYDVEKEAGPDKPASFDVVANIGGRFEAEVESTGTQIAQIDVTS